MRPAIALLVALGSAGGLVLGPAVAAEAAGSGSITTGPRAEGWYRTSPACALPTGCVETPSPYAPDTLHIGVNAGMEEDRTTLQLDLGRLPAGTKPTGGQLRLPIATGPQDGTRNPETARLRACLVREAVEDVDGSFARPPESDCDEAGVDAVYVPATAQVPAAFTVDLTPLAEAWQRTGIAGGLVLLPADGATPTDSWQVALSNRTRTGEGVARVTAAITFVSASVETDEAPSPVSAPVDAGGSALAPAAPAETIAAAPALSVAPPTVAGGQAPAPAAVAAAPPPAAPQAVLPVASVVSGGFRYPVVFLLPLLLAGALAWTARAMTRDLTPSG